MEKFTKTIAITAAVSLAYTYAVLELWLHAVENDFLQILFSIDLLSIPVLSLAAFISLATSIKYGKKVLFYSLAVIALNTINAFSIIHNGMMMHGFHGD